MKTKLLVFVVLVALTLSVKAQSSDEKPFKIGAGALIGLPVGDISDVASLAYGVDVLCEYAVAPEFGVTLSAGYLDWAKKSGVSGNMGVIPVLVGAKYFFTDNIYGSGQIGISFYTESRAGNAFTWAPGIGYKISDNLDLLLKFESWSKNSITTSFFGLRVGYTF